MVFYFTCSDPRYTIYMGRDKHENEHLIANGWPEDLWFHVDNHSSAHVYLRLPKGDTWDSVPEDIIHECSQLTKANSIEGSKLSHVRIVYTPWSNLRKGEGMADGQVGYHEEKKRRFHMVEHRTNAIVNRLNKTKVEKHNNPNELVELKRQRNAEEEAEQRAAREAHKTEMQDAAKAERRKKAENEERLRMFDYDPDRVETVYGREAAPVDAARAAALHAETEKAIAQSLATKKKKGKIGDKFDRGVDDSKLVADLFGLAMPSAAGDDEDEDGGGAGGSGGGWLDDNDDGDFWGGGGAVDVSEADIFSGGGALKEGGGARRTKERLGELGKEVEKVEAGRKSLDEMQDLAKIAHERKAQQKEKAAAKAAEKAAEEAAAAAALEKRRGELDARREAAKANAAAGAAAAAARVDADRASGALTEMLEANSATHEEELMVLEAIFGEEGFARNEGVEPPAFALTVGSDDGAHALQLRVQLVAEYPSHLPPTVEVVDGAPPADAAFIADALRELYFRERDETRAADEPAEGVCHKWSEWIKDEWFPAQM